MTPRAFLKNVFSQTSVQILLMLRAIVLLPVLSKVLGPVYYGIWSQIVITVTLLATVFTLRFDIVFVRYFSAKQDRQVEREAFFSMAFCILIMLIPLTVMMFLFMRNLAAIIFNDLTYTEYIPVLFVLLTLRVFFLFFLAYFRAGQRIVLYSAIQSAQILFEIIIFYFSILYFHNSLLGTLKILIVFNFLITAAIIFRVLLHLKPSKPRWSRLKPYLMYGLPLIPNISLQWLVSNSGRYFIAHYQNLEHVGIYAAYFSLGRMISFFYTPLTFVLYPALSKFWEESKFDEAKKWICHIIRMFLFVSVPTIFGLTYMAPYILDVLAGSGFSQYGAAILLLSSGFLCLGIYQVYVYMLHMNEKTVWILILFIFVALLNIGLNWVMVPKMGIEGAALATFVSYAVQAVSLYIVVSRVNHLDFPFLFFLKTVISAGIMYAGIRFIRPDRMIEIVPVIFLAGFCYLILMFVFRGIRKEDRDLIRKTLGINNRNRDSMTNNKMT